MTGFPRRARRFLLGPAAACVAALTPQAAFAQAYNATPVIVSGDVGIIDGAGTSRITIRSPQAVIDWLPPRILPNPYVFLPAGNVATYENGTANANFAVLNRIATLAPSRFDGTVIGQLSDAAGNVRPGGTILFYGPGGIIVGATALFDVGNLVLTTLNVVTQLDPQSQLTFVEPDGTIRYDTGLDPNARIVTEPGSRIRATGEGSAVAMIGPRIVHGGNAFVNGSTAYVAAQALEMRFNQGLFDIVVTNGTDFADAIVHTGFTTGPASNGAADRHAIYMVATPNATPVQMLLSGSIGYDAPLNAAIENGEIVLSAGHDIVGGAIGDLSLPTFGDGDIVLTSGLISSDLRAAATRGVGANVIGGATLTFLGDATFIGDDRAYLSADTGGRIRIDGAFSATANNLLDFGPFTLDVTGGEATIFAGAGANVTIQGATTLDASAIGRRDDGGAAGTATGGQVRVDAAGGAVSIGGRLTMLAAGFGAPGGFPPSVGGVGNGGFARIAATSGGVTIGGGLAIDVSGFASDATGAITGPAAAGSGGQARIEVGPAGQVTLAGGGQIAARGIGGAAPDALAGASGGIGRGGGIRVLSNGGAVDLGGALAMNAAGIGGAGPNGGGGFGGIVQASAASGRITLGATLDASADGQGGAANGGDGGDGTGGSIELAADGGSIDFTSAALAANGDGGAGRGLGAGGVLTLRAIGPGTLIGASLIGAANGAGPLAAGNSAGRWQVQANGGLIRLATLQLDALAGGGGGALPASTLALTNGALEVGGSAALRSSGDIAVQAAGGGQARGGTYVLTGRNLTFSHVNPPAGVRTFDGASFAATAANAFTADAATVIRTTGTLGVNALGAVDIAGALLGGAITVRGNSITLALGDGASIDLAATNGLNVTQARASGEIRFQAGGAATFGNANAGGSFVGGAASLALTQVTATIVNVGATAGPAVLGTVGGTTSLTVAATGDIGFNQLNGGAITLTSSGGNIVGANASGTNLQFDAALLAGFSGLIAGADIRVVSRDIDIGANGRLGNATTQTVSLTARPSGLQTVIGGTTQGPGYTLTNAEAGRIRAVQLAIQASANGAGANRAPDAVLRDLTLSATPTSSGAGVNRLVVTLGGNAPGILEVSGSVSLANAAAADGITLTAPGRLQIVTPAGSVRVRTASGAPGGRVQFSSNNIWSASQSLIAQLIADPNFAGRNAALLANSGPIEPRGYIEAADVIFQVGSTAFVQNSGAVPVNFGDGNAYAGITVSRNTLTFAPTGTQPIQVYAFGRSIGADGSFSVNNDFFREAVFGRPNGQTTSYTDASELNQCIINTGVCPLRVPVDFNEPEGPEIIEGPVDGGEGVLNPQAPNTDVIDTSFASEELIEEPVTSGAEVSVWDCDGSADERCRRQPRSER